MRLYQGDCLEVLKGFESNIIDTVITDPPYGLSFMGKDWDHGIPGVPYWSEILRVCKPGAMLLAFGGTRTFHRLTCAIEDAGWEIRDCLMWLYASGFPKSLDISKAIDKAAGENRERIRGVRSGVVRSTYATDKWSLEFKDSVLSNSAITEEAKLWNGWGSALKPAWEPIVLAMKPLAGTFAQNALEHGVAGLNIDGCRIPVDSRIDDPRLGGNGTWGTNNAAKNVYEGGYAGERVGSSPLGRWPANLILDEESGELLDQQTGTSTSRKGKPRQSTLPGEGWGMTATGAEYEDTGGASRFFYCAKASRKERGEGNNHPTVKPLALMEYLCRLTMPPTVGNVLDPFAGSGTTLIAAKSVGREAIGIELNAEYCDIIRKRVE